MKKEFMPAHFLIMTGTMPGCRSKNSLRNQSKTTSCCRRLKLSLKKNRPASSPALSYPFFSERPFPILAAKPAWCCQVPRQSAGSKQQASLLLKEAHSASRPSCFITRTGAWIETWHDFLQPPHSTWYHSFHGHASRPEKRENPLQGNDCLCLLLTTLLSHCLPDAFRFAGNWVAAWI